jgi:hypothetical protein
MVHLELREEESRGRWPRRSEGGESEAFDVPWVFLGFGLLASRGKDRRLDPSLWCGEAARWFQLGRMHNERWLEKRPAQAISNERRPAKISPGAVVDADDVGGGGGEDWRGRADSDMNPKR